MKLISSSHSSGESKIASEEFMNEIQLKNSKEKEFKILTWNLNCLEEADLSQRMSLASYHLLSWKPDVILLQETNDLTKQILHKKMRIGYVLYAPDRGKYYNMILFRRDLKIISSEMMDFEFSNFGRNYFKSVVQNPG